MIDVSSQYCQLGRRVGDGNHKDSLPELERAQPERQRGLGEIRCLEAWLAGRRQTRGRYALDHDVFLVKARNDLDDASVFCAVDALLDGFDVALVLVDDDYIFDCLAQLVFLAGLVHGRLSGLRLRLLLRAALLLLLGLSGLLLLLLLLFALDIRV